MGLLVSNLRPSRGAGHQDWTRQTAGAEEVNTRPPLEAPLRGPLVMLKSSMPAEQWATAEQRALERLHSQLKPNSTLASTAYLGIATKS